MHIESLIFSSEEPISLKEIKAALEQAFEQSFEKNILEKNIQILTDKYQNEAFSFELVEIAGGYQFLSKGAYNQTIGQHIKNTSKKRLSKVALETLSIIAYKQPVTKSELEAIRGVSCDYSIQKLLDKELVEISGRSEGPGRPLLYSTSEKFMHYFGLKSIKDLPQPKDFKKAESEVGEPAPIEEQNYHDDGPGSSE